MGCHALLQAIFQPRDRTLISCDSCNAGGFFLTEPPGKPSITRQPSTIRIYLLQTGNGFEVQSLCSQAKEVDSNYNVCFHSCVGGNVFFATNNYSDTTSFLQGKGELMIYCVIILSHHFLIWGIFALQYCVGFCCTR